MPNDDGDFLLDFATSQIAEGKALVALKGGKPLPEGAIVDGGVALMAACSERIAADFGLDPVTVHRGLRDGLTASL